jgi:hypothetical protein
MRWHSLRNRESLLKFYLPPNSIARNTLATTASVAFNARTSFSPLWRTSAHPVISRRLHTALTLTIRAIFDRGKLHVAAPLLDAGLTKQEIRTLARDADLRIWDKPASACLSSRIEYGRAVTREALDVVERGEDAIRALGFRQFRVRHHGDIVRIEIDRAELPRALDPAMAAQFTAVFKQLGFKFVTLDLEGFRSGSMNALLPLDQIRHAD